MRLIMFLLFSIALSGCAGPVVEIGSGKYFQEGTSVNAASRNAREFCEKQGKQMDPIQINPSNRNNNTELVFVCK